MENDIANATDLTTAHCPTCHTEHIAIVTHFNVRVVGPDGVPMGTVFSRHNFFVEAKDTVEKLGLMRIPARAYVHLLFEPCELVERGWDA